jgi:hypothetical protein
LIILIILFSFIQLPVTSLHFISNILLSTLFSNTPSHTRRYNSIWILACTTIGFHLFLSCAHLFQLTILIAWMSFSILSIT